MLVSVAVPDFARNCLNRAATIEGKLEALLAKIVAEYILSDEEIDSLGALRQGFQMLRQAIQHSRPLEWWVSGSEPYVAFKTLATDMSRLLGTTRRSGSVPGAAVAARSFLRVTDNSYEATWVEVGTRRVHVPLPTERSPTSPA